jgi:hypothetical protein
MAKPMIFMGSRQGGGGGGNFGKLFREKCGKCDLGLDASMHVSFSFFDFSNPSTPHGATG